MRSSIHCAPNVTPMVDVMLVLLVIFMVMTPTLLDGFRATPPTAFNVHDHPNDSSDVVLGIDDAGRYFLNKHPIDSAALGARIQALLSTDPLNHTVYVKAHESLEYSRVLAAMDIARENGAVLVGLITQQPAVARR